jgi:hypothetical protein
MYTLRETLSSEYLTALDNLKSAVTFKSNSTRLGANNFNNLSVYEFSKWKDWTREQRSNFKSCFNSSDIDKSVIGWFLNFPANTGFLDTMNTWNGAKASGTILAHSLTANNKIVINGAEVTLNRGEGIEFSLTNEHSVSISAAERNWACLMLMK